MKRDSEPSRSARDIIPLHSDHVGEEADQAVLTAGHGGEISEDEEESGKENSYEVTGPAWKGVIFALLPLLICLFGAGRETWSKGVAAILLGTAMLIFPRQRQLPALARVGIWGALIAPLATFFPAGWTSLPEWRAKLADDWNITLSETITPQFYVSVEAWLFMALCVCWLFWSLTRGFSGDQRRAMLQVLSIGGSVLCLLSILEHWGVLPMPWWPRNTAWGPGFGPFANRNHISSIAAVTCMLCAACAHDSQRRKQRTWGLFLLGFLAPLALIFTNTSRAGLVLLFVGITAWLGTSAMGRGFFKKMIVTISLVLIISTLLVISSGGVSSRLNESGIEGFATSEGRVTIYLRSFKMFLAAPWLGHGLGNFSAVFPQFSETYNLRERPIHPESDLLWLLVEGGMLTILPAALVAFWWAHTTGPWFRRTRKQRSRRNDRRLRNAAAIACGLGALHGIFDVPNHGLGYFSFLALLAGIAVRPRRLPLAASFASKTVFRIPAIGAMVLGGMWLAVSVGNVVLPGSSSVGWLKQKAEQLADSGAYAESLMFYNRAIQQEPMSYRLYFERARVRLLLSQSYAEAFEDFSRARALEPNDTDMCYREGLMWLDYRPEFAIIPWREIVIRWPRFYFGTLVQYSEGHPQLRQQLWNLATTAELKLSYLHAVRTPEEFELCLRSLLAQPDFEGLNSTQRETILQMWYQMGDRQLLISKLENDRKWRDFGWRILAEHYASNSDFKRACETAIPYLPSVIRTAPGTSTDIPALERALFYDPTDPRRAIDLFQAQKAQGDIDGALRTLEKVVVLPNAPSYVRQEIAALYVLKQDYRRAWEQLREAMQKR